METLVKVVVHADAANRPGEILHTAEAAVELPDASLDALLSAAWAFPETLGVTDWVRARVEGSLISAGGDGQSVTVVVEFLGELRGIAYGTLIGVLSAWLYDQLKTGRDGDDESR